MFISTPSILSIVLTNLRWWFVLDVRIQSVGFLVQGFLLLTYIFLNSWWPNWLEYLYSLGSPLCEGIVLDRDYLTFEEWFLFNFEKGRIMSWLRTGLYLCGLAFGCCRFGPWVLLTCVIFRSPTHALRGPTRTESSNFLFELCGFWVLSFLCFCNILVWSYVSIGTFSLGFWIR